MLRFADINHLLHIQTHKLYDSPYDRGMDIRLRIPVFVFSG
jgi:hypothetical protein